jgi:hypothetical protein
MLVFSRVTRCAVFMLTRAVGRLAVVILILGMCHGAGAQSKAGISPETLYSHNKGLQEGCFGPRVGFCCCEESNRNKLPCSCR